MVRPRLPVRRTSFVWTVAASLLVVVPFVVVGVLTGQTVGELLAYSGIPLSFAIPYFSEQRNLRMQRKKVVFIAHDRLPFAQSILTGMKEVLDGAGPVWDVDHRVLSDAPGGAANAAGWVRSAVTDDADALVLYPLAVDDGYWRSVQFALEAGVEVVVIDVTPPREVFDQVGVKAPYYVAGDYSAGGQLLGNLLVEALLADPSAIAILTLGPDEFFAGSERSRQALGELASAGLLDRVKPIPILDWGLGQAVVDSIVQLVVAHQGNVWIHPAHDGNVRLIRDSLTVAGCDQSKVFLVGYDGMRQQLGKIDVLDQGLAVATIDVDIEEQGREAGRILADVRRSGERRSPIARLVKPSVARVIPSP